MQSERVDPLKRKLRQRKITRRGDQDCMIRFVPRAREFIFVVRLRVQPVAAGKPIVRNVARREGQDLKGSEITGMILETE